MTEYRPKMLIVDDDSDNCSLLEGIFENDYHVLSANSGQACLDIVAQQPVDVVLLDIFMPEMDGYEVCRRLKSNVATATIAIIFVSALTSTEERLRGYEIGAEDYVVKPVHAEDMVNTVTKVMAHRLKTREVEKHSKEAMSTAFQAMSTSAELGYIIRYLQSSYDCKTLQDLAEKLLETTELFGLNCCLLFRRGFQNEYFGCRRDSIEAKVLDRSSDSDRIINFGARTLINEQRVSLLVKNMPLAQPENYGRIKDNLVFLINGTEARIKSLEVEYQLDEERKNGLQKVLLNSNKKLQEIHNLVEQQKSNAEKVVLSINSKIETIIFGLGLDEPQEHALMSAIDRGIDELSRLNEHSTQVEKSFLGFVRELESLARSQP